jgi:hypothetical protein
VTAIVWADGKEIGAPEVLKQFHDCRTAAWDELHTFLASSVFSLPPDQWDPSASVELLKGRLAQEATFRLNAHDMAVHVCRHNILQTLAQSIEDYRSLVAKEPDELLHRRGLFLQFLKDWQAALISPTYPSNRIKWAGGRVARSSSSDVSQWQVARSSFPTPPGSSPKIRGCAPFIALFAMSGAGGPVIPSKCLPIHSRNPKLAVTSSAIYVRASTY